MASEIEHRDAPSGRRLEITLILGGFALLALLSAAQIYFRQRLAGDQPQGVRIVLTNLLAWAPWPLLAPVIVALWRRRPFRSESPVGPLLIHLLGSCGVTAAFLVYLTLFRFALFPEVAGPWSAAAFPTAFAAEVGRFFVPAWSLYWLIGAVDLALRRRGSRTDGPEPPPEPGRIALRSLGRTRWVGIETIDWIEAAGSYVRLHAGADSHLLRSSLADLARELAPAGFVRIHRSAAVRAARIAEVRPLSHGDAEVELGDGTVLRASRTHRRDLEDALSGSTCPSEP